MSRNCDIDWVELAFIVGLVLMGLVSSVACIIGKTIEKTSCFNNGGSWEKDTCIIDNSKR